MPNDHSKKNFEELCLKQRDKIHGVVEMHSKVDIVDADDLATVYTPGVAEPCRRIHINPAEVFHYTSKANTVAIISDGTAVLGLGNIGPMAALPVMEGKAVLFKAYGGLDAIPLVVGTQEVDELEKFVRWVAPTFGGINLEDISAPRCVELVERLQDLDIPVFHDDQDGTAVVTVAALHNALKVTGKDLTELKIVINGAGAASYAITKMLLQDGKQPKSISVCDSKGIMNRNRPLAYHKERMLNMPHVTEGEGSLSDALIDADVFIGVSVGNVVTQEMVQSMAADPIVFAMANPEPEIRPELACLAGAAVVGSGRSDYPNQINNVLAFPGIFKGALSVRARSITLEMMHAASAALADMIPNPTKDEILPNPLDKRVGNIVAEAVAKTWQIKHVTGEDK